jgi:hypothetical protein
VTFVNYSEELGHIKGKFPEWRESRMYLSTILGLLGGGVAGFGAAYFIQNGKISKLQQDVSRYSQASQALVSAESELKDAKSRILILEQSENDIRRRLEQSYHEQMEELHVSSQEQINELNQMRSLKLELESELAQVRSQLENAQHNHFNDLEALKQAYESQASRLPTTPEGNFERDSLESSHREEIQALQQAHAAQVQEIEQAHQARIYELEQAYQTQILEIQAARGDEFDSLTPAVAAPETAEADSFQTFINPDLLRDDAEDTPQTMGYLETWVAPFQDDEPDLSTQEESIPTNGSRDASYLETWYAPPAEESADLEESFDHQGENSHLETWVASPLEEAIEPPQEMGYLETWVAEAPEVEDEPMLSPFVEQEDSDSGLNFLESLPTDTEEKSPTSYDFSASPFTQAEEESPTSYDFSAASFTPTEEDASLNFLESFSSEAEEEMPNFTENTSDLSFLESFAAEEEVARISSLEELTSAEDYGLGESFTHPDNDFLELLPQEEEAPSFNNGFSLPAVDSDSDLFNFSEPAEDDLALLNSLELQLGEESGAAKASGLGESSEDLDFLNLLDTDELALESLPSLENKITNDSLEDLFGSDWDLPEDLDADLKVAKSDNF